MINDPLEKICGNDQYEDIDDIAADYIDFMAEQLERDRIGQAAYEEAMAEDEQRVRDEIRKEFEEHYIRTHIF